MLYIANFVLMSILAYLGVFDGHRILAAAAIFLIPIPLLLAEFSLLCMWWDRDGIFAWVKERERASDEEARKLDESDLFGR